MTSLTIPVQDTWKFDTKFREALGQIKRCAEVALAQGPLSRRNALGEIAEIAAAATRGYLSGAAPEGR